MEKTSTGRKRKSTAETTDDESAHERIGRSKSDPLLRGVEEDETRKGNGKRQSTRPKGRITTTPTEVVIDGSPDSNTPTENQNKKKRKPNIATDKTKKNSSTNKQKKKKNDKSHALDASEEPLPPKRDLVEKKKAVCSSLRVDIDKLEKLLDISVKSVMCYNTVQHKTFDITINKFIRELKLDTRADATKNTRRPPNRLVYPCQITRYSQTQPFSSRFYFTKDEYDDLMMTILLDQDWRNGIVSIEQIPSTLHQAISVTHRMDLIFTGILVSVYVLRAIINEH
jgi:hypothetical protein